MTELCLGPYFSIRACTFNALSGDHWNMWLQFLYSLSSKWVIHGVHHLAVLSAAWWKWAAGTETVCCFGGWDVWVGLLAGAGAGSRIRPGTWLPLSSGTATWPSSVKWGCGHGWGNQGWNSAIKPSTRNRGDCSQECCGQQREMGVYRGDLACQTATQSGTRD